MNDGQISLVCRHELKIQLTSTPKNPRASNGHFAAIAQANSVVAGCLQYETGANPRLPHPERGPHSLPKLKHTRSGRPQRSWKSLNDLHRAAGEEQRHRPKYWLETQQAIDLVVVLAIGGIPPIQSKQGLGTFAYKELVYAYANWISAEFYLRMIRAYDAMVTAPAAYVGLPDFTNPAMAARAWAEQFEANERLAIESKAKDAAEKRRNRDKVDNSENDVEAPRTRCTRFDCISAITYYGCSGAAEFKCT